MVGGALVTQGHTAEIGADGCSENASAAAILARNLIEEFRVRTVSFSQ
jgi:methanogenic corrinoid protein MtbC1